MRSQVRWRIAALTVLVFAAVVSVATSRGQVAWNSKGTTNPTASNTHVADTLSATAPTAQFSKAFVGPWANAGQIRYSATAVDSQDNLIVAGAFAGRINFGGGDLVSHGGVDIFIAKYSSDGSYLWSKNIGGTGDDYAKALAVDLLGDIIVTSWSGSGTVDFGGGPISVTNYLAKYSPDGIYQWARKMATGTVDGTALQTDTNGNIIVGGVFVGPSDFGGGPIASVQNNDAFLAKYSPGGGYLWAVRAGGGTAYGTGVFQIAVDHSNDLVMTGYTTGAGDMGGVSFPGFGGNDIFLVKYSANGSPSWSRSLGGGGQDRGKGLAIDSLNNIVMTGLIADNANLGSGTPLMGGGIFLVKCSPSGSTLWAQNFPPPPGWAVSLENGNSVAIDRDDKIAITGAVIGDINLGGGTLPMSPGDFNNNTYIAQYTSTGSHLWSTRFANLIPQNSPGFNSGKDMGIDGSGNIVIIGTFSDSVDLGAGVLTNPGACGGSCGYGGYLLKLGFGTGTPTPVPPTATRTPTLTPTAGAPTNTPTSTPTPTPTPTSTPTNAPTNTPTPTRTPTNTPTFTSTPTPPPTTTPSATTNAASGITQSMATLKGTVDPNGTATSVFFEYGMTTSYGSTTAPQSIGSGTNNVAVSQGIAGLICGTVYHFRVVATTSNGTTNGLDQSFTTGTCSSASFSTVQPCRLLDTRNANGPSGGPWLSPGVARVFPVTGLCNIPSSAKSVAINLAVVSPGDGGDVRLYPTGAMAPTATAINFHPGAIRSGNTVMLLGVSGQMSALLDMPQGSPATTHFVVDVYGYFQ